MHYMHPYYELAMKICGLDPENDEEFNDAQEKVEQILYDKFGIDEDSFEKVVRALTPHAHISKSEITDTVYIGFGDHKNGIWLYKEDLNPTPKKKKETIKK